MASFTKEWIDWITFNINEGNNKDELFKILIDEGYSHDQIKAQMDFEPSIPVEDIINPQRANNKNAGTNARHNHAPDLFIPHARILEDKKAELYLVENFLNQDECTKIIDIIKGNLRPSLIVNHEEKENSFRTSKTCDLGQLNDPLIEEIDARICSMIGIDAAFSEQLQGQFYEEGQEFKAHTDFFETDELPICDNGQGQRTYTFFIYLNDVEEGGTTDFPELNLSITPKIGDALIWNNLNADGSKNYNTLHQGTPVLKGWKAIITKWFRIKSPTKTPDQMMVKSENEKIPCFTKTGFTTAKISKPLHKKIMAFYQGSISDQRREFVDIITNDSEEKDKTPSSLLDMPDELKKEIHDHLKIKLEEWAGIELEPTFVYGIRTYHNGTKLDIHRDRPNTHIISCILNVYQDVEEDWPLQIEDHFYRKHEIIMEAGDLVFYEGSKLPHGREKPLKGRAFANIFCHFKPKEYELIDSKSHQLDNKLNI